MMICMHYIYCAPQFYYLLLLRSSGSQRLGTPVIKDRFRRSWKDRSVWRQKHGEKYELYIILNSTLKKLRPWHPVPSFHGKQMERKWKRWQILFSWAPKSLKMVTKVMKSKGTYSLKMLTPWKKSYDKPRKCIKKKKHYLAYKGLSSYSYGSFSSHVWM